MTNDLTENELKSIESGYCPDCNSTKFLHGPTGGWSENIRCKNCGSEFCFCPPFPTERLDRNDIGLYRNEFDLKNELTSIAERFNPSINKKSWWKKLFSL